MMRGMWFGSEIERFRMSWPGRCCTAVSHLSFSLSCGALTYSEQIDMQKHAKTRLQATHPRFGTSNSRLEFGFSILV